MEPIRTKNREILTNINKLTIKESKLDKLLLINFKSKIGLIIVLSFALLLETGFIYVITENPPFIGPKFQTIYTITKSDRTKKKSNHPT